MTQLASVNWQPLVNHDTFALIVFLVMAAIVLTVMVLATQWRRVRIADTEGAIKMRMIEKGYKADEIERVVKSRPAYLSRKKRRDPESFDAHACCCG